MATLPVCMPTLTGMPREGRPCISLTAVARPWAGEVGGDALAEGAVGDEMTLGLLYGSGGGMGGMQA